MSRRARITVGLLIPLVGVAAFAVSRARGAGKDDGPPAVGATRVRDEFDDVDAIVYGHTHTPAHHQVKNIYFFNPGSPTRSFFQSPTLGILHIGEKIEGEIIEIK